MGLMGLFFKFAVECFNLLAWPLFALAYPLYASIQAIETDSISDTRKLITYWVCFSLILLFEHAFEKLLEWLPYWPYIKLMIISCLVASHFDGSFYVYKHVVHPFLSMNPSIVFNWLIKLLVFLELDELLIKAKRESKAMETEAVENLIAFKPKFEQPKVVQKDINALEITENNEVSATKPVTQMQSDFALSENITCTPVEIQEMTEASVVGGCDLPDIPPLMKMQKEWICAICQVGTTSEESLNSHLQGKWHEDACEKLKAKNQLCKSKITSVETGITRNKEAGIYLLDKENSENVIKPAVLCQEPVRSEADRISHVQGRKPENVNDKKKGNNQTSHNETPDSVDTGPALENKETGTQHMNNAASLLVCSVCHEIFSNMQDYTSHLQGKRHTEASEKLKAKDQPQKNDIPSPSAETGACPDSGIDAKPWTCVVCKVTTMSKTDIISHFCGQQHAEALEKLKAKPNSNSSFEPWTCDICEVELNHVNAIITHLEGKKHRNACNELKLPKNTSKAEASSNLRREVNVADKENSENVIKPVLCQEPVRSEADRVSHLQGRKPENVNDKEKANNQTSHNETPDPVDTGLALENKETGMQHMNNARRLFVCSCHEIFSNMQNCTSHLQGKRHTEASEKLKEQDQPQKSDISSPSAETGACPNSGIDAKPWTCVVCKVTTMSKTDIISHFCGQQHAEALEKLKAKPNSNSSFEPWTCDICEVELNHVNAIITHLEGKKHRNACNELKLPKMTSKTEASSNLRREVYVADKENSENVIKPVLCQEPVRSEADRVSHLQGRKPENVNDKEKANNQTSHNETPDSVDTGLALENKETGTQHMNNTDRLLVCSVCHKIFSNMQDYTSHVQGKRHTEASEKLKAKDQPQKSDISSPSAETGSCPDSGIDAKPWTCVVCKVTTTSKTDIISHFCGQQHAEALEKLKAKPNSNSSFEPWTCGICGVELNHGNAIITHLKGKKHRNACNELKLPEKTSKAEASSNLRREVNVADKENSENVIKPVLCQEPVRSEADRVSHLQGRKPENVNDKEKANNQTSHNETPDSVDTVPALENKETGTQLMNNTDMLLVCSVCHEIFSNMQDYTSHLQGKRHTEASEKLKAKDQPQKSDISSPSAETGACPDSGIDAKPWTCVVCKVTTTSKTDIISHFCGQQHAEALEKLKAKPNSNSSFEPWTCGICGVELNHVNAIITHLEGKKHRNACNELKLPEKTSKAEASSNLRREVNVVEVRDCKWWCKICDISCTGEGNIKHHLNGRKHLAKTKELSVAAACALRTPAGSAC